MKFHLKLKYIFPFCSEYIESYLVEIQINPFIMNIAGLISGGKDSMLNLIKCQENGHRIVCLVNMCPVRKIGADGTQELNSHCFQSVAQEHVPLVAKCMGLKLYTGDLLEGTSINQELFYEKTEGDEVESLYKLLSRVIGENPEVNAISTGAIESNFQRLRVMNICERLHLEHISYLWKSPPKNILSDVIEKKMLCVIVKVSSMGLDPDKFLGRVISTELAEKLLNVPYIHAAGEGGEFETFTLDCPLYTKGFLRVTNSKHTILDVSSVVSTGILNMNVEFVERIPDSYCHE